MSRIGFGYGSEWHLLRWMGRHRNRLDGLAKQALGCPTGTILWEDFSCLYQPQQRKESPYIEYDAEDQGVSMFNTSHPIHKLWRDYWPASGSAQCWDAVGWLKRPMRGEPELVLVEAKGHKGEIISDCGASSEDSKKKIQRALEQAKQTCNATGGGDWTKRYYQYANRIAFLDFLQNNGIPAHILFIYFYGDCRPGNSDCPYSEDDWKDALNDQDVYLGLSQQHPLSSRIHKLFLPVSPIAAHISKNSRMMVT